MVNQSLFQKKVLDALSPYKLTAGQPKVLDYLGKHNGCHTKINRHRVSNRAGNAYRHTITHGRKKAYYTSNKGRKQAFFICVFDR